LIERAIDTLQAEAGFRTSPHRATKDYRSHLAAVLLADVLEAAWQRAAGSD
jgi:CO/xanthine dehydrogenase FAD-binding subunit